MSEIGNNEKLKGVVKWFNDAKGFGFIEHTTGKDVFVHFSVIAQDGFKTLEDGEQVEYEMKEGPKGLHAVKVSRPNQKLEASEQVSSEMPADASLAASDSDGAAADLTQKN